MERDSEQKKYHFPYHNIGTAGAVASETCWQYIIVFAPEPKVLFICVQAFMKHC